MISKTYLLTALASSCLAYSFSQEEFETTKDYDLLGPVKSIESVYMSMAKKPEDNFELLYGTEFNENGYTVGWNFAMPFLGMESKGSYVRESNGHIIEERNWDGEKFYTKSTYKYDELGRLSERTDFYGDGTIDITAEYEYNDKNQVQRIVNKYPESGGYIYEYTYDDQGRKIKFVQDWEYFKEVTTYEYDSDGNIILEEFVSELYADSKESPNSRTERKFNAAGQCTESITWDANGKVTAHESRIYNEEGVQTHFYSFNKKGKVDAYTVYSEFDHHGNWTQAITYYKNKISATETREIKYFPN